MIPFAGLAKALGRNASRELVTILKNIDEIAHTRRPIRNARGGRPYGNIPKDPNAQKLPDVTPGGQRISYYEYDVLPKAQAKELFGDRGRLRVVLGDDGSAYFAADHYTTFVRVK